jgi:hypothetical protein
VPPESPTLLLVRGRSRVLPSISRSGSWIRAAGQPMRPREHASRSLGRSVFSTPVRSVLSARPSAAAGIESVPLSGAGLSQQAYALRAKIFDVEDWLPASAPPVWRHTQRGRSTSSPSAHAHRNLGLKTTAVIAAP